MENNEIDEALADEEFQNESILGKIATETDFKGPSEEEEPLSEPEKDNPDQLNESDPKITNSGDYSTVFDGTGIGTVNINQSKDQYIFEEGIFKKPIDQKYSCPYCLHELDSKKPGKYTCESCGSTFFVKTTVTDADINRYKTLNREEEKQYEKILAHINNHIRDKNYPAAFQYCLKAKELAPGEVTTWEQFTITEFLLEITQEPGKRKKINDIVRSIKAHLEKCIDHGMNEEEYEPLVSDIANRLFNIEKSRLNSKQPQYRDNNDSPKWSRLDLNLCCHILRSFDICYNLFDDCRFLEGYVDELSKPYKWMFYTKEGKLINSPACGTFNAEKKFNSLVEKIKTKKREYVPPEILEERFIIKHTNYLKINSVTAKTV